MLNLPTYTGMNGLGTAAIVRSLPANWDTMTEAEKEAYSANLPLKTVNSTEAEMAALDCGFLETVTNDGHGGPLFCGKPGPKSMLMLLFLAPVMVPLGVADGIVSNRPVKRWMTPMPTDKTVLMDAVGLGGNLGFAGIPIMIGAGLVSLYLWYKIYGYLKGKK
jgi:hypothetical protein